MTKDEALRLALSTLSEVRDETFRLLRNGETLYSEMKVWDTIYEIKKALETKDEPVAMRYDFDGYGYKYIDNGSGSDWQTRIKDTEPLYAKPPQRKPLTDEQILHIVSTHIGEISPSYPLDNSDWINFSHAIEAAHGIKE